MEQAELVIGFSELKDLLIEKYQTQTPREKLRLYFIFKNNNLFAHDFRDHSKFVLLSRDVHKKSIDKSLGNFAYRIIQRALNSDAPAQLLNNDFLLYGYFIF